MSKAMTDAEIAAEQALMRTQRAVGLVDFNGAAEAAPLVSDEEVAAVTPVDLLFASNYTTREIRDARLDVCRGCPQLFKPTKSCKSCGCFMGLKTWISNATCPEDRWH